jgi:hypothetical protein
VSAAVNLLRRAANLFPNGDSTSLELAAPLTAALFESGAASEGVKVLADAEDRARQKGDERLETLLRLNRRAMELRLDPDADVEQLFAEARAAVERFGPNDDALLVVAWENLSDVEWFRARLDAARTANEQMMAFAERVGDVRRQAETQAFIGASGFFGRDYIDVSLEHSRQHAEWAEAHGALAHYAAATFAIGASTMEQGRVAEGRELREQGWTTLRELGMRHALAVHQAAVGAIVGLCSIERDSLLERLRSSYETLAGRTEEARAALESALEIFESKGFARSADALRAALAELQSSGRSPSQ